jgi:hypothetical protein
MQAYPGGCGDPTLLARRLLRIAQRLKRERDQARRDRDEAWVKAGVQIAAMELWLGVAIAQLRRDDLDEPP